MPIHRLGLRATLLSAALLLPGQRALADASAASLADLRTAVTQKLSQAGVPGAAVVLIESGRIVLTLDHGVADRTTGRPVAPDTVFRAGSISKTFTALAALALAEEGRLQLDAPLAELLPEWAHDNPWATTHPVRLEHLLEHSAGLDDVRYRHYLLDSATMPLREALPAFGPYAVRWAPGSGTAYSNAGPLVAGRALERAAGQDFERLLAGRVFEPLGMDSARWTRSVDIEPRLARSYGADLHSPEPFIDTPARPSGSLNLSARDLARLPLLLLGRGQLDGVRVLSPASVQRMETPRTGALAAHPVTLGWGPGLQADADGRTLFFGHDGSIDGFVAHFAYAPALGGGYVVMANALSDAPQAVARLLRQHLERGLPMPPATGLAVSAAQREAWSGQYQTVTPRQELLRGLVGLTQWEGAQFEGDVLRYAGKRWLHLGDGVFRAEGTTAPALVFLAGEQGMQAHGRDGTRRRVPAAEAGLKLASLGLLALLLPLSLLHLPLWAHAAWRGRLRGSASARWAPAVAMGAAVAVPLGVLALLGTGDLAWLGQPSLAGWAVAGLGLLAPLLWLLGAWVWHWQRHHSPASVRALGGLQLLLSALLLGWLGAHGWLGLRIWV